MARFAPGSALADFFICVGDQPYLDADLSKPGDNLGYAVFGHVASGMATVKKILAMPTDGVPKSPDMKGQILTHPVKITTARRAAAWSRLTVAPEPSAGLGRAVIIDVEDEDFAALADGVAPRGLRLPECEIEGPVVLEMLRGLRDLIGAQFAPAAWMMVEDGEIVGLCSITALLGAGEIKIGYGVAPCRRGRGAATRMHVADVVAWACSDDIRVSAIVAETGVDNWASQRVLEANGFFRAGARLDPEDGELIG